MMTLLATGDPSPYCYLGVDLSSIPKDGESF